MSQQPPPSRAAAGESLVVKTTLPTLPMPSNAERAAITTERLVLRALRADDLEALHELMTQEAVMRWTAKGRTSEDVSGTQEQLDRFLPPHDTRTRNCAICDRATGRLIGIGGVHRLAGEHGWPEAGYLLREEWWGQGLATEFVRGFLADWDALPRSEVEVRASRRSAGDDARQGDVVEEQLVAITVEANHRSQNVLAKSGFERLAAYEADSLQDPTAKESLVAFRHFPGREKAA